MRLEADALIMNLSIGRSSSTVVWNGCISQTLGANS